MEFILGFIDRIISVEWAIEGMALGCLIGLVITVKRTDKIIDKGWENFTSNVLEKNDSSDQNLETMVFIAKAVRAGFTLITELLMVIAVALCIIAYVLIS